MTRNQFDFEFGKKHSVNSFQLIDELTDKREYYNIIDRSALVVRANNR